MSPYSHLWLILQRECVGAEIIYEVIPPPLTRANAMGRREKHSSLIFFVIRHFWEKKKTEKESTIQNQHYSFLHSLQDPWIPYFFTNVHINLKE